MPDNDLLAGMLTDLQTDVAALRVQVARLEMRCSWTAGALGLIGGAIPVAIAIVIHFLAP